MAASCRSFNDLRLEAVVTGTLEARLYVVWVFEHRFVGKFERTYCRCHWVVLKARN